MRPIVSLSQHRHQREHMLTHWRAWQQAQGLSERTITEREYTLKHLATHAETPLDRITPDHIIAYCGRPALSQSARATYHATFRAFYKWAHQTKRTKTDPTQNTPRPKRTKGTPRPYPSQRITTLINTANRRRTKAMIILATYAGLRAHEIAKFHSNDIDTTQHTITVTGKGGKTSLIPAHQLVVDLANTMPAGYWFPAYNGSPHIGAKAVSTAIKNAMKRAGFTGKAHQLRHYYASELLDNGVDIRVVKELMRHESIATTEIYTRVNMRHMRDGLSVLKSAA